MPKRNPFACDPLFKDACNTSEVKHTKCSKGRNRPTRFTGQRLNAFLKQSGLDDSKEYQVCHGIFKRVKLFKIPLSTQQSTIRRAHVSLNAVRERTAVVSTDSNMRELQAALRLIVECDFSSQNKEIRKRFIWMMSVDDEEYKQAGLFVKLAGGAIFKVLEVKPSKVEPVESSGFGVFACCNFAKGEVVTIYCGKVIEKNVNSIYSITNTEVTLDAGPWMEGDYLRDFREEMYLGAHIANDASWVEEGEEGDDDENNDENDEYNIVVTKRFEFVASKPIKAGDELLLNYNYKYT